MADTNTPRRPAGGRSAARQPSPRVASSRAKSRESGAVVRGSVNDGSHQGDAGVRTADAPRRGKRRPTRRQGGPAVSELASPILTGSTASGEVPGATSRRRSNKVKGGKGNRRGGRPPPRASTTDPAVGAAPASPIRNASPPTKPTNSERVADAALTERIEALQEQCEYYTKRIEVERRRADELDKKLKISRAKLEKMRSEIGRMDGRGAMNISRRKLSSVEHRLDKMSVRLNQALNKNKKLKLDIEDLRREKMQRENIKRKLEREVKSNKRELLGVIHESQQATDARDKAERLAAEYEQVISAEMSEFETAFQQRMQDLEAERQQHEHRKLAAVAAADTPPQTEAPGALDAHGLPFKGEMTIAQEQELKHRSTKAIWEVVKREVDLKQQEARLRTFDDAFKRIQGKTGINTIDDMVAEFCDAEDHNFSLINIINGLNKEIEHLEVQIADMEQKLRDAKGRGEVTAQHRNKIFAELEAQIHAAEKKARWYNHKHDEALKAIVAIKPGLLSTFQKVGCSDDATLENVAATGITDGNIMQVLGIIEQRIAEIVQMNELALGRFAKRPEKKRGNSRHGRGEASMLPSTLESSDSDSDDGAAPVSLATLKARTANAMAHKLARGQMQLPNATPSRGARHNSRGGFNV